MEPGKRQVGVEYHVTAQGNIGACRTARSSRDRALDRLTCSLIVGRFRFRPSRDEQRRPVESFVDEDHNWIAGVPHDQP